MQSIFRWLVLAILMLSPVHAQEGDPAGSTTSISSPPMLITTLKTPQGEVFEARTPVTPGRRWARFIEKTSQKPLMGARLWTTYDDGMPVSQIQWNNGTLEPNNSWQGIVRFNYLGIEVRSSSTLNIVSETETAGRAVVLYQGPDIPWAPRLAASFRFALAPPGAEPAALARLTYAGKPGPWAPLLGSFGPLASPLPSAAGQGYPATYAALYQHLLTMWKTGAADPTVDFFSARHGLWQKAGEKQSMAPGGTGIRMFFGEHQCREGVLVARWRAARFVDRMRVFLYDSGGRAWNCFTPTSPMHDQEVYGGPFPGRVLDLPMFIQGTWGAYSYKWYNGGAKPGDEVFYETDSEVCSHAIRVTSDLVDLWEYTGDNAAREDFAAIFEYFRMANWSNRPDEATKTKNPDWGWIPYSLTADLDAIKTRPHTGYGFDRAFGWAAWMGAQMQRMEYNRKPWLDDMILAYETAVQPNGIVQNTGGPGFPADIRGTQAFHSLIMAHGLAAACKQVGHDAGPMLTKLCSTFWENENLAALPYAWNDQQLGNPWWIGTHKLSGNTWVPLPVLIGYGQGDVQAIAHTFTLTYLATHDVRWLKSSLRWWQPHESLKDRLTWLQAGSDKNWSGLQQAVLEAGLRR